MLDISTAPFTVHIIELDLQLVVVLYIQPSLMDVHCTLLFLNISKCYLVTPVINQHSHEN